MNPIILFRSDPYSRDELAVARRHLPVTHSRCDSRCDGSIVVGRYSVLPFYGELIDDLANRNARLINSLDQHRWIADFEWYHELAEFTPRSWTERAFPGSNHPGPFVVKGATNSKKHQWRTHMYAETRADAIAVAGRLHDDGLVGTQPLVYREYVPLVTYEVGINDLPFTNEWRLFFLGRELLAAGYYWSEARDAEIRELSPDGLDFARTVAHHAAESVNFFVLDIAEKVSGGWTLVEVNDGQMSGVSMCDPEEMYCRMAYVLPGFDPV